MRAAEPTSLRVEVQALRALAVALVVAYHLFPHAITGGFVGVDVFFVISGFLITGLLLREVEGSGRVALGAFWARRVRRILPAALLVLAASAIATVALVPVTSWDRWFTEMRASAAYVQNWQLASSAVDYFAAQDGPSPAQHYWSLSIEEQFYLVWPLLLSVAALLARRRRAALGAGMLALTAASLAYSIHDTAANPAAAYFVTPTRMWELGAGGLLALGAPAERSRAPGRGLVSWLGLAAIGVAAGAFSDATPFPGAAALLPVLGAVAVIAAGMPAPAWSPAGLMRLRPIQALGDLSYSVYLWHWPIIVVAPFVLHHAVGWRTAIPIVALTLALSVLTKRLVEDPVRRAPGLVLAPPARSLALGAVGTLALVAMTVGGTAWVHERQHHDRRTLDAVLANRPRCFGAASRDPDPGHRCVNPALARQVVPSPLEAPKLPNSPCPLIEHRSRVVVCAFGVRAAQAKGAIALLGDSHASALRGAVDALAKTERWQGYSITRTGCPFSTATPDIKEPDRSFCVQWVHEIVGWLADHPRITTVFVTAHARAQIAGRGGFAAEVADYARAWRELPPTIKRIVVIRDTPIMRAVTLSCIQDAMARHANAGAACAQPRAAALGPDPEIAAAAGTPRVQTIDLSPVFCDRTRCYPVIGGALVYHDVEHLTHIFAATLGPILTRRVEVLARRW